MHWLVHVLVVLQWLALSMATTDEVSLKDTPTACDDNWVFNDGFCYFFSESDDVVNPSDAGSKCLSYDAEHVTPRSEGELSFLQSQAKLRTTYGWSLNLGKSYNSLNRQYYYNQPLNFRDANPFVYFNPAKNTVPKIQKSFNRTSKCVALHVADIPFKKYNFMSSQVEISSEPCDVELWVTCQSKLSAFPKQRADYEKWFIYENQLFWLSGKRANQADADAICKKANMKLITSLSHLIKALNVTYDYIPWWTGFTIAQDGPVSEDGIGVDFSTVSWLEDNILKTYGDMVLLHSGNGRIASFTYRDDIGLPYICKKRSSVEGLFGCPNLWFRAGRSCYSFSKHNSVPWSEAKKSCESRGSHLLTINSVDEKLWLEAVAVRYVASMWTSANDIAKEGAFKWHDGSAIDSNVISWQKAPYNEFDAYQNIGCMGYYVKNSVFTTKCDDAISTTQAACQYGLFDGETQCVNSWKKFNDTCYGLFLERKYLSYQMNEIYCRTKFGDKFARPLMVKTKEVADFLKQAYPGKQFVSVWLGMKSTGSLRDWRWDDGTLVDLGVFNLRDQPDNGSPDKPENCMIVNRNMRALDESCNKYYPYICEKDLSPVRALGLESNRVSSLQSFMFTPSIFVAISMFGPCLR